MARLQPKHLAALRDMAAEEPLEVETTGGCMAPLIEDGVMIRVEPRRFYWPGDVVVVQAGDELRAHRLIGWVPGRGGWRLVTQSDAMARRPEGGHDDPVRVGSVLGRITGGECAPQVTRVPPRHRLRSVGRFLVEVRRSLLRRVPG